MKRKGRNLTTEQYYFKVNCWKNFCFKKYPAKGISHNDFIRVILQKMKKLYHRYSSFYCLLEGDPSIESLPQLNKLDKNFFEVFNVLCEIKHWFPSAMKPYEKDINRVMSNIEEFSIGLLDEILYIHYLIKEKQKKELSELF